MAITIKNLNYFYDFGTPFETAALTNINLEIKKGEFVGLIGHTGSGKSTLVQHLNGLLKASSGSITVNGIEFSKKGVKLSDIRKKVGLVFQYPEYQLFEETIYKDIAFGPSNLGLSQGEIDRNVKEAMSIVGLEFETFKDKSPFELSGGQKRRVAIAGVLAMNPEILMLDEPTAGLDPKGRDEILGQIRKWHEQKGTTVILVSHSMEDVARLVDRIIVMDKGTIALDDHKIKVFQEVELLERIGLAAPQVTYLTRALKQKGININEDLVTIKDVKEEILRLMREKNA